MPSQSGGCEGQGDFLGRFAPTVDRIRQRFNQQFGLKAYDVFMVWTRWNGAERGEGNETLMMQVELLPTPVVEDLTSLSLQGFSAGTLPVGSVRISQVSASIRADTLSGFLLPSIEYLGMAEGCGKPARMMGEGTPTRLAGLTAIEAARLNAGLDSKGRKYSVDPRVEFFYEIVERAPNAQRQKFRLLSVPFKRKGSFDWTLVLERVSEDRSRRGQSTIGPDPSEY